MYFLCHKWRSTLYGFPYAPAMSSIEQLKTNEPVNTGKPHCALRHFSFTIYFWENPCAPKKQPSFLQAYVQRILWVPTVHTVQEMECLQLSGRADTHDPMTTLSQVQGSTSQAS